MIESSGEISCAQLLKVLADDTRLAVVRLLMQGPRHVGEINREIAGDVGGAVGGNVGAKAGAKAGAKVGARVGGVGGVGAVDQSLLSHHLKVLRDVGMVESERDGKAVLYRLSPRVEAKRRGDTIDLGCCRIVFD